MGSFYDLLLASKLSGGGGGGGGTCLLNAFLDDTYDGGAYANPDLTYVRRYAFAHLSGVTSLHLENVTDVGSDAFYYAPNLKTIVMPKYGINGNPTLAGLRDARALEAADFPALGYIPIYTFASDIKLATLILRKSSVVTLQGINALDGTCFASGKTGGTLYVPNAVKSQYQSASNWSTILGYTNNQIKSIEGSIYENAYADGTPIS